MAFPTTYNGWIEYVRDWLNADEYSEAQVAAFLDLAQVRLNREMEAYGMEAVATVPVVDTDPITILTSVTDFNKVRLVSIVGVGPYDVMAINEMKSKLEPNPDAVSSNCKGWYCIDAGKLYLYPRLQTGSIELFYYKKVPALSTSVATNVFSVDHPDALLYAALLAAAPYMGDNEDTQVWEGQYAIALAVANAVPNSIKRGSTPLVRDMRIM